MEFPIGLFIILIFNTNQSYYHVKLIVTTCWNYVHYENESISNPLKMYGCIV
jgi:hypothetical protein